MSNALTLARPYARAAFELAKGEQAAAAWSAKLGFAAQIVAQAEVQALIGSPKLGASDRVSLFLPQGEAADGSFARFLNLLEHNQRLPLLFRDQRPHQAAHREVQIAAEARNEGTIVSVSDGIVRIHGLADVMHGEMIELPGDTFALALNLERDSVGAVVLGDYEHICARATPSRPPAASSKCRSARNCSAAWSTRWASRSTARARSTPSSASRSRRSRRA
jgi:hypothetical protein